MRLSERLKLNARFLCEKRIREMYDYDESVTAECFRYFLIYGILIVVLFFVNEIFFGNTALLFFFSMALGARLFTLAGDGLLTEDRQAQEDAKMRKFFGNAWSLNYFPIPAFIFAFFVSIISHIFSINETTVIGFGQVAFIIYALYIVMTKRPRRK